MSHSDESNPVQEEGVEPGAEGAEGGQPEVAEAEAAPDAASLAEHIEKLQAEVHHAQENAMRAQAEMQNVRKRSLREVEQARKFALERFMSDLLEVNDTLEKGLEVSEGEQASAEQLQEGTELTLRILRKVFEKHGLQEVDPAGAAFDPELHEAMSMLPSEDQEPNTVLFVIQKGFLLNGRLLRPARVIVASAP
ncbi:MAG: nucleotide exchange factor GrpE [Xanthomonadales bacterium]|nr:nucleotide exchange factor GrpE [Xanthomonadales bacterium]